MKEGSFKKDLNPLCSHTIVQTTVSNEIKESCSSSSSDSAIGFNKDNYDRTKHVIQAEHCCFSATADSLYRVCNSILSFKVVQALWLIRNRKGVLEGIHYFLVKSRNFFRLLISFVKQFLPCFVI